MLAYYIAAINIEATYHSLIDGKYVPFEGICLTDTFQMYEKEDLVDALMVDNSARRKRQKKLDIRVIVGNPPYSAGQTSANDNNANVAYPVLDERIRATYAAGSTATLKNALYDSYIRSIRWASDRIGNAGIIGFVTNAGFVEANTADGLRKCLVDEFSSLYVFHLRGNQRTSGETSRREGGKIFGSGSRAPIAISLLVKNPNVSDHGQIFYHDIGDYLTREEKLEKITALESISGITDWQSITPDEHGDWLKQRDHSFSEFLVLGDKKNTDLAIFENYSGGVKTNRDAWAYNGSKKNVAQNMKKMIDFYNLEVERFFGEFLDLHDMSAREAEVNNFINTDPEKISWDHAQKIGVARGKRGEFLSDALCQSLYRPFTKQWLYMDRFFNNRLYQMPKIFPHAGAENLVIQATGVGSKAFSVLISSVLPCLDNMEKGQSFPLYLYEEKYQPDGEAEGLFTSISQVDTPYNRRDAITDAGLTHFKEAYPDENFTKEDLFYYVYGLLHSPDYRERYADNLSKELPRIPRVKTAADFWTFSKAGRDLAHWHLNYETVAPYPLTIDAKGMLSDADYRVEKMKFAKKGDKSTVIYNGKITLRDIPAEAWEYVVNGKAALDWVMERQSVKTDKASGIVNDANDWAIETMGNPKYPLELFQRVVTVSLETQKIVAALPKLDI